MKRSLLFISTLFCVNAFAAKIGAVYPLSGPIATYGQESVNGMKLALEKINKEGIKGEKLEVVIEDNKGEPLETSNAVKKLIDVDKVSVVFGAVASSNTLAGAPIAQQSKVPMLTPASTNEKVTETGDFISRTCFTDAYQGLVMAKFAFKFLKKRNAAIIIDSSSDYSKGLAAVFKEKFTQFGGKIIDEEFAYQQGDKDFLSLLRKVKRVKPDVVFLPGYYTEVGLMLKQARQNGLDIPFLGGDGWDSPKLQDLAGPEGIKNNYISSHFSPDDTEGMVPGFVEEYVKRYKQKPGAMAALGYDGTLVIADALRRAKSMSAEDIKMAINSTKDFEGVTGKITINDKRNAVKSAVVLETTASGNVYKTKVNP